MNLFRPIRPSWPSVRDGDRPDAPPLPDEDLRNAPPRPGGASPRARAETGNPVGTERPAAPFGAVTYGEQALARRTRVRELLAQRTRLDREIVRLQREANGFEYLAHVDRRSSAHHLEEPKCPERLPE